MVYQQKSHFFLVYANVLESCIVIDILFDVDFKVKNEHLSLSMLFLRFKYYDALR